MIVEIARNDEREAVFAVASEHIAHAKVGMPVKVWLQGRPEIAVTGSIREISPEADSTTGTYQVKVALPHRRRPRCASAPLSSVAPKSQARRRS